MHVHKRQGQVANFSLSVFKEKLYRLKSINVMDQAVVCLMGKDNINGEPNA